VRIQLVCLEDGITSCGFRKLAAYAERVSPGTESLYVSTRSYRTVRGALSGTMGTLSTLLDDHVDEIAQSLRHADVVGFSSMTGYADLTRRVIRRVRELNPSSYLVWGGIHPIIEPEDAIQAGVDGICTGEGEFAFEQLIDGLAAGRDVTGTPNFWFRGADGAVIKNRFLPLQTPEEMETLPFPQYGAPSERIYEQGKGFVPLTVDDYLHNDGLGYPAIWSIGCPLHCSYCGNTKFIANDANYRKLRHPSARYIVEQVKDVKARFPHLSQVSFHDDSFMAIRYSELEEFAELWRAEVGLPFAVYGVIPTYVKRDKFELLSWAGMNRIRMGIQSGSKAILDFYKRPTPPERILQAGSVASSFAPKYHIPPVYDIIMDNPIEKREDVVATLELLYALARPYTLLIYSLKVIPNTGLAESMKERGIDLDEIDDSYLIVPPRVANLLLYLLVLWRPPRWLWERLLRRVRASSEPQPLYPRLGMVLRTLYLAKRVLGHLRVMDLSITPGKTGHVLWRLGIVERWQRWFVQHPPRPARASAATLPERAVAGRIPIPLDG
jgi:anaerobic magnesium-protoporphyrin IX monomethyl ester cyclase